MDAFLDDGHIEINQKSKPFLGHLHMREKLGLPYLLFILDCLNLAYRNAVYQNIQAEAFIKCQPVIHHRYWHLALTFMSTLGQLVTKAHFINMFKQTGAECFVNDKGGIHNVTRQLLLGRT